MTLFAGTDVLQVDFQVVGGQLDIEELNVFQIRDVEVFVHVFQDHAVAVALEIHRRDALYIAAIGECHGIIRRQPVMVALEPAGHGVDEPLSLLLDELEPELPPETVIPPLVVVPPDVSPLVEPLLSPLVA